MGLRGLTYREEKLERWIKKRVLIVVRTYPSPAEKGVEVSCTAAVTEDREWMRLFPVPYRFLEEDQRFRKYQWIDVDVTRANKDFRPESFHLNIQSIRIGNTIANWPDRQNFIYPLISKSLCQLQGTQQENGFPTLGLFKPQKIIRLNIDATDPNWSSKQTAILSQMHLFSQEGPKKQLEKIPFTFRYSFRCSDTECKGHELSCTDWEMGQSFRRWRTKYGDAWESKFRQRYEIEMQSKFDTHFFVGTVHQHPNSWIIVGLFYPPKPAPLGLFPDI